MNHYLMDDETMDEILLMAEQYGMAFVDEIATMIEESAPMWQILGRLTNVEGR